MEHADAREVEGARPERQVIDVGRTRCTLLMPCVHAWTDRIADVDLTISAPNCARWMPAEAAPRRDRACPESPPSPVNTEGSLAEVDDHLENTVH
jgi:hypothetical protein